MRREARRREENKIWWKNNKIIASGAIFAFLLAFLIGIVASNSNE